MVNGSCSGVGCCEVEVPDGLKYIEMKVRSYDNHTDVWGFNSCGYAFVAEQDQFDFNSACLKNLTYKNLPVVLEWAIGNETCKKQLKTKQLSHVRGIVTAKTFKSRRGIFASASKVTKGTHTSLVVAKVRIIHL